MERTEVQLPSLIEAHFEPVYVSGSGLPPMENYGGNPYAVYPDYPVSDDAIRGHYHARDNLRQYIDRLRETLNPNVTLRPDNLAGEFFAEKVAWGWGKPVEFGFGTINEFLGSSRPMLGYFVRSVDGSAVVALSYSMSSVASDPISVTGLFGEPAHTILLNAVIDALYWLSRTTGRRLDFTLIVDHDLMRRFRWLVQTDRMTYTFDPPSKNTPTVIQQTAGAVDRALSRLTDLFTERHYGPGAHPSGTSQGVHAGGSTELADAASRIRKISEIQSYEEILDIFNYWSLNMTARLGRSVHIRLAEFESGVKGLLAEDDHGNVLTIQTSEVTSDRGGREQVLTFIEANNKGTGMGTAFLETMKDYVDLRDMDFRVVFVSNPAFYQRFDWLRRADSGWESPFEEYRNYVYAQQR